MTQELKQMLKEQYNEMWKYDYLEIAGSALGAGAIGILIYLFFSIAV